MKSGMTEEALQHIWQYQVLNSNGGELKTKAGENLQIIHVGHKNFNQGPDFLNSKIKIDNVEWNGNVEIHLKSSLWNQHNHHVDPNYDNVILHVVLEDDKPVLRNNGEVIPCVELDKEIDTKFITNYDNFLHSKKLMPCEDQLENVREITKKSMLERVLVERLERKSQLFGNWLHENNGDWENTAFEAIAYCLGLKINATQFQILAHSIGNKTIQKHIDNRSQIEAMLFGNAGFLELESTDEYMSELKNEYKFLRHKYNFNSSLTRNQWNFHQLRPPSFPTVRIAQLAAFLMKNQFLFSQILEIHNMKELKKIFDVELSSYWSAHFDFGKEGKKEKRKIGDSTVELIIINGVIPLLYLYYKKTEKKEYLNRIFHFLESLKKESNSKINLLKDYFEIESAYDSQSVLELYTYYCLEKKCLSCSIGCEII